MDANHNAFLAEARRRYSLETVSGSDTHVRTASKLNVELEPEVEPISADDDKQKFDSIWFDAHKVLEAKLAEAFSKEDYSACTPLAEAVGQVVAMKPDTCAETLADPTKAALAETMVDQLTAINPTASAVEFRTLFLRRASAVGAKKPRLH